MTKFWFKINSKEKEREGKKKLIKKGKRNFFFFWKHILPASSFYTIPTMSKSSIILSPVILLEIMDGASIIDEKPSMSLTIYFSFYIFTRNCQTSLNIFLLFSHKTIDYKYIFNKSYCSKKFKNQDLKEKV